MSSPKDINYIKHAVDVGSMDLLRRAVSLGNSVQEFEAAGSSLINEMVSSCVSKRIDPPNIAELLRMGADPNLGSPLGMSPLLFVIVRLPAQAVCEAVVALLCAGADINALVDNEISISSCRPRKNQICRLYPMALAIQLGNVAAVGALLLGGASPNGVRGQDIISPLSSCAQWKEVDIADLLLRKGADPNLVNFDGTVALHYCWDLATAQMLHQYGADPAVKDKNQRYPLHEWAERSHDAASITWLGDMVPDCRYELDEAGLAPLSILKDRSQHEPGVSPWADPIISHWEADLMRRSTSAAYAEATSRRL